MERKLANPAPLGLGGFALTTFVLNVHNAGIIDLGAALPLGLFYGGLAQLCAGLTEFATGNTFGMVAFSSYGAFWIALAALVIFEQNGITKFKNFEGALLWTLIAWTIFTALLTWATFYTNNWALQLLFVTLTLLFILLDINIATGGSLGTIPGWEGIVVALIAWYLMIAEVINPMAGRTVLPILKD